MGGRGAGDLGQVLVAQLRLAGGQVLSQTRQAAVTVQRVLCGRDGPARSAELVGTGEGQMGFTQARQDHWVRTTGIVWA